MTDTNVFGAPWDQKLTWLTLLFSAILLGATALMIWIGQTRIPVGPVRVIVFLNGLIPIGGLFVCALLAPRSYAIRNGTLRINRWLAPIEIPLASVEAVEALPVERLAGARRTLGNGGLFGYYGQFRSPALGSFRMYATRGDGYVLVRAGRLYVVTPQSPDLFIERLNHERALVRGG